MKNQSTHSIPPSILTKERAQKILNANLANIVKRLAAGKTLTATETAMMQAVALDEPPAPAVAKNKVELAKILGVTRQNLRIWAKMRGAPKPNADSSLDVVAWREFQRTQGLKGGETAEEINWRERLLQAQAERVEFNNAVLRAEYVLVSKIEKWEAERVTAFKNEMQKIPDTAAQTCAGRDAVEISGILKEMIHDALMQLHRGKWARLK